jgi:hypothetical protein
MAFPGGLQSPQQHARKRPLAIALRVIAIPFVILLSLALVGGLVEFFSSKQLSSNPNIKTYLSKSCSVEFVDTPHAVREEYHESSQVEEPDYAQVGPISRAAFNKVSLHMPAAEALTVLGTPSRQNNPNGTMPVYIYADGTLGITIIRGQVEMVGCQGPTLTSIALPPEQAEFARKIGKPVR